MDRERLTDALVRYARPILLVVSGALTLGVLLTLFRMPLIGWSIYGLGYVGLLVAFAAVTAVYRRKFDWFAWLTLGILYVGLFLGIPVVLMLLGQYAAAPGVDDPLMPFTVLPIAMVAGILAWLGLGLFGLAGWRLRALPTWAAVLFVAGAIAAVPAEFGYFSFAIWTLGILLASVGMVVIASDEPVLRASREEAATSPSSRPIHLSHP